jgi:hypothetical protein
MLVLLVQVVAAALADDDADSRKSVDDVDRLVPVVGSTWAVVGGGGIDHKEWEPNLEEGGDGK